ncbi:MULTISPECIES: Holliday junction branch migration protein RuvA [Microbacterium]|uniref:Holliday junction branch migration protein RuvA n=1 Tax=Microbacterium TaxID=33882 RepID=UPI0027829BE1|nr:MULTISPECIES: Holliday junction branch migration protein RuvA [Microbacterium]MDQ1084245.1 Holliday junction DNA helicase RuvA [Microbacterium sp. SORGH_AS_0344]MDQ1170479.1 Holliday junction DNA helicase RuvA [Microbacterium proteolyticum]
MISSLQGRAAHVADDSLVIVVGGVGFSVAVTAQLARTVHVGDDVHLHTNLIVREDALSLYGFETREELTVFAHLISVTGVGPKSALGVLSSLTVPQIAQAVADDDDAPFRRVSGIGPKTAKLIVVQLAGKLAVVPAAPAAAIAAHGQVPVQVTQALVGLGWTERTAAEAVASVAENASEADRASVQALLRLTLALLGPARKETVGG